MSRPILYAVIGIALLSVMDAIIKGVVGRLPVVEVAFLRYCVGSLAMLVLVSVARPGWPSAETLRANALRAILVVITATSFFYALGQLPLAETLILSFVSPIFTAFFAALVLRETLHRRILLALAGGFAGVVIVISAGLGGHGGDPAGPLFGGPLLGVAAVLVSAIGYSASNVLLRARAQRDPLLTIVAMQNLVPALILAVPAYAFWIRPDGRDAALLVCIGLLGVSGHLCLARAYARAEAVRLAPLDYTALIWALALGLFAFGEVPTLAALLGSCLIVGAAWLVTRR